MTTVPALAPEATPAQRAWAALHFIKLNPELWDQNTFGKKVDGVASGCLAFHVVRMAGYEVKQGHACSTCGEHWDRIPLSDLPEQLATDLVRRHGYAPGDKVGVEQVGRTLLDNREEGLFGPGCSLQYLEDHIAEIFGPDPLSGVTEQLDQINDAIPGN